MNCRRYVGCKFRRNVTMRVSLGSSHRKNIRFCVLFLVHELELFSAKHRARHLAASL